MNVEHGHAHGQAAHLALNGDGGLARGVEQRDVGGGSAHVETEKAFDACAPGNAQRAGHAAGRTGENGPHRLARRGLRGKNAPRRLHDAESGFTAGEAALERPDVAGHARREICVQSNCGGALVFAELGQHLV